MQIHREGKITLRYALLAFIFFSTLSFLLFSFAFSISVMLITGAIGLFLLQFFRNPTRHTVPNERAIIAPADGKVVVIEEIIESEYFQEKRRQLSIFMSPFNVHVNRFPISGKVTYFNYHPGKYLVAWHPKSSTENERTTMVVQHGQDTDKSVLVRQIAGLVARRIRWYIHEGSLAEQGKEFGFIKFGSRIDVILPLDATVKVTINQHVKGGETVLATF